MPRRPQLMMPTIEASPNIPQARLMPESVPSQLLGVPPQPVAGRARSAEPLGAAERRMSVDEQHQGALEQLARLATVML